MMTVRLFITVAANACPYVLTVTSFDGRPIYRTIVSVRRSAICFETCEENIVIGVYPFGGANYPKRYLKSERGGCFDFFLNYADQPGGDEKEGSFQAFYLSDLDYGFPIAKATLFLDQV